MIRLRRARPLPLVVALACCLPLETPSRAAQVDNLAVVPRDARTATITVDVTWNNSWRHESNHDAVWVFFKMRKDETSGWQHVRLAADKVINPTGYGREQGTPVDCIVPDGEEGFLGMIVRRAEYGLGTVAAKRVSALWDLSADAGPPADVAKNVRAFAIEMVFVPEGPFCLGFGGTEPHCFYTYTDGQRINLPYRVENAGPIQTGRQAGKLWARRGAEPEDNGAIPADFPNGYRAIYTMKTSPPLQGQYGAFLGTLDPVEARERTPESEYHLSWLDAATFVAWAALRPMTELEYEKISRGPYEPGWDNGDTLNHPSFWGVEGMNGWRQRSDRTVTVANAAGRGFKGTHGRGTLALPADWPQADAVGAGLRGGHGVAARPAYRLRAAEVIPERGGRAAFAAARGVRTAPPGVGP